MGIEKINIEHVVPSGESNYRWSHRCERTID